MTKDEIINSQDGQALADAVAVEVMGFATIQPTEEWQPHFSTEKGKAQCWDLAVMLKMRVNFNTGFVRYYEGSETKTLAPCDERDLQKRVLKAALLSQLGEE